MDLQSAGSFEIGRILRETFKIWSPGLTRDDYLAYIHGQLSHPWARKNLEYLVLKERPEGSNSELLLPAASLKYYRLTAQSRGKLMPFAGLGAIYVLEEFRGLGLGRSITDMAVAKAREEGMAGLLLFSDIDPWFYEQSGFVNLRDRKFYLTLKSGPVIKCDTTCELVSPNDDLIALVERHYKRWQVRKPLSIRRDATYWHFKLWRERFLNQHSKLSWPALEIISTKRQEDGGYCLIEYGGNLLRVLEMIGTDSAVEQLWLAVIMKAQQEDINRISGWESALGSLSPGKSASPFGSSSAQLRRYIRSSRFEEKIMGKCMILPIAPEVSPLLDFKPCPILEMDHL